MIEIMPESAGKIVGVKATGRLTDADYKDVLIPELADRFSRNGKLDVLFFMAPDFVGWDLEAAWDDASFGLKHRADFGKIAVVGGPEWVDWCIRLSGFLMKGEIKTFAADRIDHAWSWLKDKEPGK